MSTATSVLYEHSCVVDPHTWHMQSFCWALMLRPFMRPVRKSALFAYEIEFSPDCSNTNAMSLAFKLPMLGGHSTGPMLPLPAEQASDDAHCANTIIL